MTIEIKDKQLTITGATDTVSITIVDGGIQFTQDGETWTILKQPTIWKINNDTPVSKVSYSLWDKEDKCPCPIPVTDPIREGMCYACTKPFRGSGKTPAQSKWCECENPTPYSGDSSLCVLCGKRITPTEEETDAVFINPYDHGLMIAVKGKNQNGLSNEYNC